MTPTVAFAVGVLAKTLQRAILEFEGARVDKYLVVLTGAGLGGLARYVAGTWIMQKYGGRFPLGTFVINVTGSFLIGVLMTLLTERWQPHPNWRLFLVVGVLGGYTTFSSFEYESYQAVRDGAPWMGLLYVLGSVLLGYFGVWLGAVLAARS
jgi:fluoride exporter